jgi:flagellar basal body-associated protein FliL
MSGQYQVDRGAGSKRQVRLILALFIIAAAVVGILFIARTLKSRQARIEETQEEIAAMLDELDPLARVQVADYVIEREREKYRRAKDE